MGTGTSGAINMERMGANAAARTSMTELPAEYGVARWYAAYTWANHEKKVREQLEQRSVEAFLPVYETLRRWKDRRVPLEMPLFPGYVFVRLALVDRLRVLQVPSVVRLVGFNGHPSALPDEEFEALKKGLACGVRAKPHPFLTVGRRVLIKSGPLEGRQGILLRRAGRLRVVLSIDLIMRSLIVEVDAAEIEPIIHRHILLIDKRQLPPDDESRTQRMGQGPKDAEWTGQSSITASKSPGF
jgi:transcription antitermination factor NusG